MSNIVPIIIPAYEPDERMICLLDELCKCINSPIIVVNDGSGAEYDYLYEKAEDLGCIILINYKNCGKGRALKNAFNYCLTEYKDMVGCVTADSDGQHTVKDILRCKEALLTSPDSLVLGCRDFGGEDVPIKSKFGNNLTRKICKVLCGLDISDTQTGLRGIPRAFMAHLLNTAGERFEFETRMLIEAKELCKIEEIEIVTVYDSKENHQTHFDPIKDSIRIYKIFGTMFLKFIISSLSSSVVDLFLFNIFIKLLCSTFNQYIAMATIFARIISATYNYLINYKIVFQSNASHDKSAKRYLTLAIVQMLCSALFTTVCCSFLVLLPELIVKIIVDGCLFFISYSIQREYVFRNESRE